MAYFCFFSSDLFNVLFNEGTQSFHIDCSAFQKNEKELENVLKLLAV